MDKELVSLLSHTGLVRNTSSIVIGYLTDPPPLPFIKELDRVMSQVKYTCDHAIFYDGYFNSKLHNNSPKIYGYNVKINVSKLGTDHHVNVQFY
jgi:hypothetical protein